LSASKLQTSIEFLKSVGPSRAEILSKELDIKTWSDLLYHFPFRYVDKTIIGSISDAITSGEPTQFLAKVTNITLTKGRFKKRLNVTLFDGKSTLKAVWFQGAKWVVEKLNEGEQYLFYGTARKTKSGLSFAHPEFEIYNPNSTKKAGLEPVYSSTELLSKLGLDSKFKRRLVVQILKKISPNDLVDPLGPYYSDKFNLIPHGSALHKVHFPKNMEELAQAKHRLIFEDLFFLQLSILFNQSTRKKRLKGLVFKNVGDVFMKYFKEKIPFELTKAQKRVVKEIRQDLGTGVQMNRLLQGDVGSGKTMVALLAMLLSIDNNYQACMMAPTEILAQQHFKAVTEEMKGMNVNVGFLSGSVKGKKRKETLKLLKEGVIHILIGTHALIEDWVVFKQLGIAIIDEQHRFGVAQRAALWGKSDTLAPHILVMTATPIPRTLALTAYGDLDVSVIDELPPGRKPITTRHLYDSKRVEINNFLELEISKGRQVYIVFPLIEESATLDLRNLEESYERLLQRFPRPNFQISIVHGKMKPSDKESEMQRFVRGETQIMLATTVIEVGVNVPNASVMVIENAERFGLSQLHQLRGRVGRGADKAYCILVSNYNLSVNGKKRLATMVNTQDGFEIAEVDLELRGPGNIEGTQQSGVVNMKMAHIVRDQELLIHARAHVKQVLSEDPSLRLPKNEPLMNHLKTLKHFNRNWGRIS